MRGAVPLIALLASGCAPEPAPFTPSPPVSLATPFLLELNAAPGVGTASGRAVVTARVLNANYAPLPNTEVQFTTAAGTFSAARVATDADGRASTTLTAPPGSVQVTARAASLEERVLVSVQPATQPVPPPPNQPEPSPPEPDFALGIDFVTPVVYLPTRFWATGSFAPPFDATWRWEDGSTTTTSATAVDHVFSFSGTFPVTLTLRDSSGRSRTVTSQVLVYANAPIFVNLRCTVPASSTTATCSFTATQNGTTLPASDITGVTFNWGDGSPETSPAGISASHVYASGSFLVNARATVRGEPRTASTGVTIP